jgi:hypothetical protein
MRALLKSLEEIEKRYAGWGTRKAFATCAAGTLN